MRLRPSSVNEYYTLGGIHSRSVENKLLGLRGVTLL